MCACGSEEEDIPHLVARCPLLPPTDWDFLQWNMLPSACSAALLFLSDTERHLVHTWKRVCRRVVRALVQGVREPTSGDVMDWKGHEVEMEGIGRYTFCTRCHIARRARDAKYIAVRPCVPRVERTVEGDVNLIEGHHTKLIFHKWKISSLRERYVCLVCEESWWATSTPKGPCVFLD